MKRIHPLVVTWLAAVTFGTCYLLLFNYIVAPVPPVPAGVVRVNDYLGIRYRRPLTEAQKEKLLGPNCVTIRYRTGGQFDDVTLQCGADKYTPVRSGFTCQHTSPEEMTCVPGGVKASEWRTWGTAQTAVNQAFADASTVSTVAGTLPVNDQRLKTPAHGPFPKHPVVGQVHWSKGVAWVYANTKQRWLLVPCTWEGPGTMDCNFDGTHRAKPKGYRDGAMKPVINYGPPVTETDPISKACKDGCADSLPHQYADQPPGTAVVAVVPVDPRGWYLLNSYQYYVPKRDGKTCAFVEHLSGVLWAAYNLGIQKESNPIVGEPAAKRQVYEWCGHDDDVLDNIRGTLTYGNHSSPIPAVRPDTDGTPGNRR